MKEKLVKELIEAEGQREYWRIMYNSTSFFNLKEEAKFKEWDKKVEVIRKLLIS